MLLVRRITAVFRGSIEPELLTAQMNAFAKQAPLLYIILNINVDILAYTFYNLAPWYLTFSVPIFVWVISIVRIFYWVRASKIVATAESAPRLLRLVYIFAIFFVIIIAGWGVLLFPYGTDFAKSHVSFCLVFSVVGCTLCLIHLRGPAILVATMLIIPATIRFMYVGGPVLSAMAINFYLFAVIVVYMLMIFHENFAELINSQKSLRVLSDENFQTANRDGLTGLANRRRFFHDLDQILKKESDGSSVWAVGLLDLDGFKPVNDVYGHAAGDRVLIEVASRLVEALGPSSVLARLGGDEFAVAFSLPAGSLDVSPYATAIRSAIGRPIVLPNGIARVAVSIGFAMTVDGDTPDAMVDRADHALYFAKARERGGAVVFSAEHESLIRLQSRIEQEMRLADFDTEMSVAFQPIVNVESGRIIAYEALARWDSERLGRVAPVDFIAAAERTGLINRLTEVLFGKSLLALKAWPATIGLSFNLSARDIASAELIARIEEMVTASGIAASRIAFEITETALMLDFGQARQGLLSLRARGAHIALDDFGVGYSSLHYVHRLPLNKLKIDRSFVSEIVNDKISRDVVKSVVDLCRNLGMSCIVEGVETIEQVVVLRALGCVTMQGYYFGRPAQDGVPFHQWYPVPAHEYGFENYPISLAS